MRYILMPPAACGADDSKAEPEAPRFVTAEDFGKAAAKIRGLENTLTDIRKAMLTLDTLVEVGLLAKTEDGKFAPAALKKPEESNEKEKPGSKELLQQVEALRKQLAERDKQLAERERALEAERERIATNERRAAIVAALAKKGAINPDRDAVHLMPLVVTGELGGYVVKQKDPYGNEREVVLESFVEEFLKQNPELARPAAQPGSGTPSGTQGASGKLRISRAQIKDPAWYAANREKILAGQFELTD